MGNQNVLCGGKDNPKFAATKTFSYTCASHLASQQYPYQSYLELREQDRVVYPLAPDQTPGSLSSSIYFAFEGEEEGCVELWMDLI